MRSGSILLLGLFLLAARPAPAATIAVDTTEDEVESDGDCSLRGALQAANGNLAVETSGAYIVQLSGGSHYAGSDAIPYSSWYAP